MIAGRGKISDTELTPRKRKSLRAPLTIIGVVLLGLLGGYLAKEIWVERFSSANGQAAVVDDELKAAAESLRDQVISDKKPASTLVQRGDASIRVTTGRHFGIWSILPAAVTLAMCLIFREPLPALALGVVTGALVLDRYNVIDQVFLPGIASESAASLTLLYLWLLGGLLGVWSKTGASLAFADWTCRTFVRGPRSAKLVAWVLGLFFFQGGTISTVLVGTTVRPVTERNKISPEELSYIVDSTASPIASLIPFNAWPIVVVPLIFVPGVEYLVTESDRMSFFFRSVPLSFYSIFAVTGTFLLAIDKAPVLGTRFRAAISRSRQRTPAGAARPSATATDTVEPMGWEGEVYQHVDPNYRAHYLEFLVPLVTLIGIAVGTGIYLGKPQVHWAFAVAFAIAVMISLFRGMDFSSLVDGVGDGLKSVTVASVVLVLAVVLGGLTRELGAGLYVSAALGDNLPLTAFPGLLFVLTGLIAFSTGTSFGTYAIAYPLTMPMAVAMAEGLPVDASEWFVMICFAAVLNGSVWGDQCSPISDTTILSSLVSGCDLMEHVRTQIVPALLAGLLAVITWTVLTIVVT